MTAVVRHQLVFQGGLFEHDREVSFDAAFAGLQRVQLDDAAWVDFQAGWVKGSDQLFEHLQASRPWRQRLRRVYGVVRKEPRLTAPWFFGGGEALQPPVVEQMRHSLSARYGVTFDSIGFNLYRDGDDAVAWHQDTIDPDISEPIVALVALGERRKLLLRPQAGGASRVFSLGRGDLLVMGGTAQRTWEHSIPRVAQAGPRISLAFRYGLSPRAYDEP